MLEVQTCRIGVGWPNKKGGREKRKHQKCKCNEWGGNPLGGNEEQKEQEEYQEDWGDPAMFILQGTQMFRRVI